MIQSERNLRDQVDRCNRVIEAILAKRPDLFGKITLNFQNGRLGDHVNCEESILVPRTTE